MARIKREYTLFQALLPLSPSRPIIAITKAWPICPSEERCFGKDNSQCRLKHGEKR